MRDALATTLGSNRGRRAPQKIAVGKPGAVLIGKHDQPIGSSATNDGRTEDRATANRVTGERTSTARADEPRPPRQELIGLGPAAPRLKEVDRLTVEEFGSADWPSFDEAKERSRHILKHQLARRVAGRRQRNPAGQRTEPRRLEWIGPPPQHLLDAQVAGRLGVEHDIAGIRRIAGNGNRCSRNDGQPGTTGEDFDHRAAGRAIAKRCCDALDAERAVSLGQCVALVDAHHHVGHPTHLYRILGNIEHAPADRHVVHLHAKRIQTTRRHHPLFGDAVTGSRSRRHNPPLAGVRIEPVEVGHVAAEGQVIDEIDVQAR